MKVDLNSDCFSGIIEYCRAKNYNCGNCKYSIKKYIDKEVWRKSATCIFSNCPCDWNTYYKEGK